MKNRIFAYFFVGFCMLICAFDVLADSRSGSSKHFARDRSLLLTRLVNYYNITDNEVLKAIKKVKRHKFVPEKFQERAYIDERRGLHIGYGQTISPIHTVALMTQSSELKSNDRILEIGTGSGYQAAVLAEIVSEVYTIEIIKGLADSAKKRLRQLGYTNIKVKFGDGFIGWKEHAPYDAIIITAAVNKNVPEPLIQQLAADGRVVFSLTTEKGHDYMLIRKVNGKITQGQIIASCEGTHFVPMTGEHTGVPVPVEK